MNEEINAWMSSGQDYNAGVALYEKFGTSGSLKRLLSRGGPTKNNIESLVYELSKLVKVQVINKAVPIHRPASAAAAPIVQAPVITIPKQPVFEGRRPNTPEVDELSKHIIDMMKVRDALHTTLEHVSESQRRKDAAMILQLSDEISDGYERLDQFNKTGSLPVKKEKVERKKAGEMSVPELMKLQTNLRSYVSRYKRLMEKAKGPQKREEHRRRMDTFQLELNEVDKLLSK